MRVKTFSINFGPTLFSFIDRIGTKWKIGLIPLGGYVQVEGTDLDPVKDGEHIPSTSLKSKTPLQKIFFALAGPLANIITAYLVLFCTYTFYGHAQSSLEIKHINQGSPAAIAGLKIDDKVISINKNVVTTPHEIQSYLHSVDKINHVLELVRDNKTISLDVVLHIDPKTKLYKKEIGFNGYSFTKLNPWDAAIKTNDFITNLIGKIFSGISKLFSNYEDINQISGPIGIATASSNVIDNGVGIYGYVYTIVFLSLNLAIFNLIPLPVLDGGHIVMACYELIFKSPISLKFQSYLFAFGAITLLGLFLLATWNDITRLLA